MGEIADRYVGVKRVYEADPTMASRPAAEEIS